MLGARIGKTDILEGEVYLNDAEMPMDHNSALWKLTVFLISLPSFWA